MKKSLQFGITTVLLSAFVFFACKKQSTEKPNANRPDYNTIALTDGQHHNAALNYYNNTAPLGTTAPTPTSLSKEDFITALGTLVDYGVTYGGAVESDIQDGMDDFVTFLENNNYFYEHMGNDYLDISKMDDPMYMTNSLLSSSMISQSLYDEIEEINSMIDNDEDPEDVLLYVNNIDVESYSGNERTALESFISVYNSSYDYWHQNPSYRIVLDKTDKIIVADAVGALVGAIPLPIAAITVPLTSAACSIAKNHGWWAWF